MRTFAVQPSIKDLDAFIWWGRYTDSFFLSGVTVGEQKVWRMTPRLPLPSGSMEPRDLVQKTGNDTLVLSTVLFDWGAARGGPSRLLRSALHFEGAVVATVNTSAWPAPYPSASAIKNETRPSAAAWGLWIVQRGEGGVKVVAEEGGEHLETAWPVPKV